MKTLLALITTLAACAANPSAPDPISDPTMPAAGSASPTAPDPGNPLPAASSEPLAGMTWRASAAAGRVACATYDGCAGAASAVMIAAAWAPVADGARVEFAVPLAPGQVLTAARGIADCEVGGSVSVSVKVNDPYNGWEVTFGPVAEECDGHIRGIDLEVDSAIFAGDALPGASSAPSATIIFDSPTAGQQAAHYRGVEAAIQ
jgi:hypothetical protein